MLPSRVRISCTPECRARLGTVISRVQCRLGLGFALPVGSTPGSSVRIQGRSRGGGVMRQNLAGVSLVGFVFLAVMSLTVAPASAQLWGDGAPICTATNDQTGVKVVDDGENGMYVLWSDNRTSG